jgi:ABC-type glycerol-3-phosphate transport system permease component
VATDRLSPVLAAGPARRAGLQRRLARLLPGIPVYVILTVVGLAVAFPFWFMLVGSFMKAPEVFTLRPRLLPEQWQLDNFRMLFREIQFARQALNTLVITGLETLGVLFVASLAGFSFAKTVFPGRQWLFVAVLATMMLPHQITLIPLYQLMTLFHWRNNFLSVIVPALFSPFAVFFMRQYIGASLPDELVQAAQIDGCSFFGIYWRICLPIIPPGLAAIGILTFVGSWNAFMWPLLMLDQPELMTIPVGLTALKAGAAMDPKFYEGLIAGTALATLPLVVVFMASQRFFVAGLTSGAVKGGVQ